MTFELDGHDEDERRGEEVGPNEWKSCHQRSKWERPDSRMQCKEGRECTELGDASFQVLFGNLGKWQEAATVRMELLQKEARLFGFSSFHAFGVWTIETTNFIPCVKQHNLECY